MKKFIMDKDYSKCYIFAEVGSVHDGSFGNACKLIEVAAQAGADAVKFQTHIADAETIRNAPQPPYFKGEPRYVYFRRTAFSETQWHELKACCQANGVSFVSSPFSETAVELLERVGVDQYKVASGEVTNLPMLARIGQTGKPVLLSSGMSSWEDLDAAVAVLRKQTDELLIMQCTSEYPCPYERVGLNVMTEMAQRYDLPVGLSDHTLTNYCSFAAVTLGASAIERHLTFSRSMYGSDARHSLLPEEFADLVAGVRAIETALAAPVDKTDASRYQEMKTIFQKSLIATRDLPAGTVLAAEDIAIKKPGSGVPPARLEEAIGRRLKQAVAADTPIPTDAVDWDSAASQEEAQ